MFSVSRGPIREAISVLASKGIITVKPGSGIFLNHNDDLFSLFDSILNDGDHDIFELLELRIGVESYAAFFLPPSEEPKRN